MPSVISPAAGLVVSIFMQQVSIVATSGLPLLRSWLSHHMWVTTTSFFSPKSRQGGENGANEAPTKGKKSKGPAKQEKDPSRPSMRLFSSGKRQPTTKVTQKQSKAVIKVREPPTETNKPMTSIVKMALTASSVVVGAIYVVYPTALLLIFRVSEQFSWLQLFQHYHSCRTGTIVPSCFRLGAIQASQVGVTVGSIYYFYQLYRGRLSKYISSFGMGAFYFALFWMAAVAVMRLSVDGWELYQPNEGDATVQALTGKVAVVTGANRGIGLATAEWLATHGAHVVITCRSLGKCQPIADRINQLPIVQAQRGIVTPAVLDLSNMASPYNMTVELAEDFPEGIHYVFCNAGTTPQYPLTNDMGLEDGFGGMHLAHMALVLGLLPSLRTGAINSYDGKPSRVVMVSSEMSINAAMGVLGSVDDMFEDDNLRGERMRGDGSLATSMPAYGRAKLCNVLFAMELNRRMAQLGWPIVANAVHTGAVVTDSSRNSIKNTFEYGKLLPGLSWLVGNVYFPLLWRNVDGGARTLLCAALSEESFVTEGGQYLDALCRPFLPPESTWREKDYTPENIISIPLGSGKTMDVFLDPVQALMVADRKYSKWLWNISLEVLEGSPAIGVVEFAPAEKYI